MLLPPATVPSPQHFSQVYISFLRTIGSIEVTLKKCSFDNISVPMKVKKVKKPHKIKYYLYKYLQEQELISLCVVLNKTKKSNLNWSTQVCYIVWTVMKNSTKRSCEKSLCFCITCVFYTGLRLGFAFAANHPPCPTPYQHAVWDYITRDKHC